MQGRRSSSNLQLGGDGVGEGGGGGAHDRAVLRRSWDMVTKRRIKNALRRTAFPAP